MITIENTTVTLSSNYTNVNDMPLFDGRLSELFSTLNPGTYYGTLVSDAIELGDTSVNVVINIHYNGLVVANVELGKTTAHVRVFNGEITDITYDL